MGNIDALITTAAEVPEDPNLIPDDTLISIAVWAHLQGVEPKSVISWRTHSAARRKAGESKPGDYPPEDKVSGQSPLWKMSAYRKWAASRPGKGAGAGRPPGSGGPRPPKAVRLPLECPHCHNQITGNDVPPLQPGEASPRVPRQTATEPQLTAEDVAAMTEKQRRDALAAGKLDHLVKSKPAAKAVPAAEFVGGGK